MLLVLRRQKDLMARLGGALAWEDILSLVGDLEKAHPQIARGIAPQLEYPWEGPDGAIRWPARDLRIALSLEKPTSNLAPRVLRFATMLASRFDQIFP